MIEIERKPDQQRDLDYIQTETHVEERRRNPRLVFTNPDAFFGRDFFYDLLQEQQEQM